jgi:hypothetical protein
MSTRRAWIAGLLVLASLGIFPGLAAATTVGGDPCAAAQQALESGDLTQADKLYTGLSATHACARQGLTATGALSAARQLIGAGLTSAADTEIVRALEAVPLLTLPADIAPTTTGQRGMTLAKTLDADGFHTKAMQILLQVVENDPSIRLDPTAQDILGMTGPPWYEWWRNLLTSPVALAVEAALLLVAVGLYPRMRRRLHLQPFTVGDIPVSGADPAELRQRVWEELRRLADEHARTDANRKLRLDIAGPYEGHLDLGPVADGLGPVWTVICGLASGLLNRVRGRCRLVTGVLLPEVSLRLGIETVDGVSERGTVIVHQDLGMPDPHPAAAPVSARFYQLALPAAAWIILTRYTSHALGGTRQWRSFVQFAVGCAWQEANDLARASEHYTAACEEDPRNTAAAVNLAALQQQDLIGRRPGPSWDDRLQAVIDATEGKTDDPQWYRARYLKSLGALDFIQPDETDGTFRETRERDARVAREYATQLAIKLEERAKSPGDLPEEFIRNSQGAALTLAARLLVPETDDLAQVSTDPAPDHQADGESVIDLLASPGKGTPEKLVAYVAKSGRYKLTPQAKYNLLRYKENRQRICEEAIAEIRTALADGQPIEPIELLGGSPASDQTREYRSPGSDSPHTAAMLDVFDSQAFRRSRAPANGTTEGRARLELQLRDLEQAREEALAEMAEYRRDIENSDDPLLRAAIKADAADHPRTVQASKFPASSDDSGH